MRKLILALAFVLGSCIAPIVGGDAPAKTPAGIIHTEAISD